MKSGCDPPSSPLPPDYPLGRLPPWTAVTKLSDPTTIPAEQVATFPNGTAVQTSRADGEGIAQVANLHRGRAFGRAFVSKLAARTTTPADHAATPGEKPDRSPFLPSETTNAETDQVKRDRNNPSILEVLPILTYIFYEAIRTTTRRGDHETKTNPSDG